MTDGAWARLIGLDAVMAVTEGSTAITIGLLDGAVDGGHPGFTPGAVTHLPSRAAGPDQGHGTKVAGVLAARRDSGAPGVCPAARLVVRRVLGGPDGRTARPGEVAAAIAECVAAGVRLVNLSAAFVTTTLADRELRDALDLAAGRGVIVVAAAGNAGQVTGSPLVSHPWVVPVTSCDRHGQPLAGANLGFSIGRRGVRPPGEPVPSLAPGGGLAPLGGTSLAAALVTGAIALAWSAAAELPGGVVRHALAGVPAARRGIVPPLLDAAGLYRALSRSSRKGCA
ncbi:hypothetical protein Sru01_06870 [Sphaerisporangium rufum]|uniref:Peptidase S8/S53 domain-containing protein n=1 Tax=Sphaerisporangium rufum TaxID=1381558 RepID=A0A919V2W8_9ACTN|nr:S8 family serine peptidase [Sphaerisporangium rufum]GII75705.1 hypothetical protein Sru01_06870 [Sphaerisporangium rufum]